MILWALDDFAFVGPFLHKNTKNYSCVGIKMNIIHYHVLLLCQFFSHSEIKIRTFCVPLKYGEHYA